MMRFQIFISDIKVNEKMSVYMPEAAFDLSIDQFTPQKTPPKAPTTSIFAASQILNASTHQSPL